MTMIHPRISKKLARRLARMRKVAELAGREFDEELAILQLEEEMCS